MKTTYGWYNGGNGTNSSGFSGLPGGYRNPGGYFSDAGVSGSWWSSTPSGSFAWDRYLDSYYELSPATTNFNETAVLSDASGMPSERSEGVLNS